MNRLNLFCKILGTLSLVCIAVFLGIGLTQQSNDEIYSEAFHQNYKIYSPLLPDTLFFAGERVPVDFFHVRERLDRELLINTYWQSNSILLLKRAHRWFPVIEPILKKNGIPDDMKYLAMIESSLIQSSSPAGAKGFWQFIKPTAEANGLAVNEEIDERLNIRKATEAACKYLKKLYSEYGSWTLAAAAYNTGETNMNYHLRNQNTDSYYLLHLTSETNRYVFRILAMKLISETPEQYGFYLREKDLYAPVEVREVQIDSSISNLFHFARTLNIPYGLLKSYNPWLVSTSLPNKTRTMYTFLLPADSSGVYALSTSP